MGAGDSDDERLVKSRQRVADHGEVFTPRWLVDDMLDLVGPESERLDARFLEPACGSGNFLVRVLERKLTTVQRVYGRSDFERRHHGLFALMCIYGVELLPDNVDECRANLRATFAQFLRADDESARRAATAVVQANIVWGDALAMTSSTGGPIVFAEWSYLGKGRFQRRDFRFDHLTARASHTGTLFDAFDEHDVFVPVLTFEPTTIDELAA